MKQLLLLFILLSASSAFALTLSGKVLSIHDGDTITILPDNGAKKSKVRLLGVDTPEIDFNGASQGEVAELARDYLKSLLPLNAVVKIELDDKNVDVNGRYLGVIFYQGQELNLEILKAGWGATYFIYPFNKKILVNYQAASKLASENHLGIFSDKFKTQPFGYMFRQMTKGVPGTNLVADYETKKLYSGEDTELVPHYHRVFFSSEETALGHGFSW